MSVEPVSDLQPLGSDDPNRNNRLLYKPALSIQPTTVQEVPKVERNRIDNNKKEVKPLFEEERRLEKKQLKEMLKRTRLPNLQVVLYGKPLRGTKRKTHRRKNAAIKYTMGMYVNDPNSLTAPANVALREQLRLETSKVRGNARKLMLANLQDHIYGSQQAPMVIN